MNFYVHCSPEVTLLTRSRGQLKEWFSGAEGTASHWGGGDLAWYEIRPTNNIEFHSHDQNQNHTSWFSNHDVPISWFVELQTVSILDLQGTQARAGPTRGHFPPSGSKKATSRSRLFGKYRKIVANQLNFMKVYHFLSYGWSSILQLQGCFHEVILVQSWIHELSPIMLVNFGILETRPGPSGDIPRQALLDGLVAFCEQMSKGTGAEDAPRTKNVCAGRPETNFKFEAPLFFFSVAQKNIKEHRWDMI